MHVVTRQERILGPSDDVDDGVADAQDVVCGRDGGGNGLGHYIPFDERALNEVDAPTKAGQDMRAPFSTNGARMESSSRLATPLTAVFIVRNSTTVLLGVTA